MASKEHDLFEVCRWISHSWKVNIKKRGLVSLLAVDQEVEIWLFHQQERITTGYQDERKKWVYVVFWPKGTETGISSQWCPYIQWYD